VVLIVLWYLHMNDDAASAALVCGIYYNGMGDVMACTSVAFWDLALAMVRFS
jgi:hypothetical protein